MKDPINKREREDMFLVLAAMGMIFTVVAMFANGMWVGGSIGALLLLEGGRRLAK